MRCHTEPYLPGLHRKSILGNHLLARYWHNSAGVTTTSVRPAQRKARDFYRRAHAQTPPRHTQGQTTVQYVCDTPAGAYCCCCSLRYVPGTPDAVVFLSHRRCCSFTHTVVQRFDNPTNQRTCKEGPCDVSCLVRESAKFSATPRPTNSHDSMYTASTLPDAQHQEQHEASCMTTRQKSQPRKI